MSIPFSLNGFNVDAAVSRMLGRPDLWWEAVGLFYEHYADWEREWLAAHGDDMQERRKVHALRSAAANVGAERLAEAAAALDELLSIRLGGCLAPVPASVRTSLQECYREVWRSLCEVQQCGAMTEGSA